MPTDLCNGARVRIQSRDRTFHGRLGRVTDIIRREDGTVAYVAVALTDPSAVANAMSDLELLYTPSEVEVQ